MNPNKMFDRNFSLVISFADLKSLYKKDFVPERVLYHEDTTIVFWPDGTKTTAKTLPGDKFSKDAGYAMCVMKKLYGNIHYQDFIDNGEDNDNGYIKEKKTRYNSWEKYLKWFFWPF